MKFYTKQLRQIQNDLSNSGCNSWQGRFFYDPEEVPYYSNYFEHMNDSSRSPLLIIEGNMQFVHIKTIKPRPIP